MTLIDPEPITPAQWEARNQAHIAAIAKLAAEPVLRPKRRDVVKTFSRIEKRENDRRRTAERWALYQANPFKSRNNECPVHTIDGLEPYIKVRSQTAAGWICNRPPERMPNAMRLGQFYGGRKWGKVQP